VSSWRFDGAVNVAFGSVMSNLDLKALMQAECSTSLECTELPSHRATGRGRWEGGREGGKIWNFITGGDHLLVSPIPVVEI
jgi:hypothetical protein